jgi:hypothetical protein
MNIITAIYLYILLRIIIDLGSALYHTTRFLKLIRAF